MPRPRVHDPDAVLDAVEALLSEGGPGAVTVRAVSAAAGLSNGALYHSFGSRAGLMAHAWLRAGLRFLALQRSLLEAALSSAETNNAASAVAAVAGVPVVFEEIYPGSSKLLLTTSRAEVLSPEVPTEIANQLENLDAQLVDILIELAVAMWQRKDSAAVDVITTCVVDLPTAILLRRNRLGTQVASEHLNAAVQAVLSVGPPALEQRH